MSGNGLLMPQPQKQEPLQKGGLLGEAQAPHPLKARFDAAIKAATVPEKEWANEFTEGDGRYAETKRGEDSPTGQARIYINKKLLESKGASKGYMKDMVTGEALHLLKDIDPARHKLLVDSALSEPEVVKWMQDSYAREQKYNGEQREFMPWLINSRFDQMIGGYMYGGKNSSIPTMRNWDVPNMPFGTAFRAELSRLKADLEIGK